MLTGQEYASSGRLHVYVTVCDGEDIERFLKALHERLWLAGFGWIMLGGAGQLLERSPVDRVCGTPERLVFEGQAVLVRPIAQDLSARNARAFDGKLLDTKTACPDLDAAEKKDFRKRRDREAKRIAPESAKRRKEYIDSRAEDLANRTGIPLEEAQKAFAKQCDGLLSPEIVLEFDDDDLAGCTVRDVLANPDQFIGRTLADPIEGIEYGRGKAKVLQRRDGTLWISSFAHGGGTFRLLSDGRGVSITDFYAYMPTHSYIFVPTREMWVAGSINARIPPIRKPGDAEADLKASVWIDQNSPVEQMTWAPGFPMIIDNRLISDGGWIDRQDVRCFNLYRPPSIVPGDAREADRWIDHLNLVFPDDADHITKWLAHRVQSPQDKINHALVLGGDQGIGKDTILVPVKRAVGPWNFAEITPVHICGRFNGFLKSVILRINEARDLGDWDRFKFYEHMKIYTAAPPDVLRVDEKNLREHAIMNCCGVIITTNHKTDGIYLPADDRRHYVAWSDRKIGDFTNAYWDELNAWFDAGGAQHVAAYLADLDLTNFSSKAPPPKTPAFWEIVGAGRAPEDAEFGDVLDLLGRPDTVTIKRLLDHATDGFAEWLRDRRNSRRIPHRLEECGYVAVRNSGADDGLWKVGGKRQAIYAKASMSNGDRYAAALKATATMR
jgi:Family of unknown function (DUF5906)